MKHLSRMMTAALAALWLTAAPSGAAEADDWAWPEEWTAFGPVPPEGSGTPDKAQLVPGERLKTIPGALDIGGQRYEGMPIQFENGALDLSRWFNGVERGKTAYLLARLSVPRDLQVEVGAGANWWMHWWLDGEPVYDTLMTGNRQSSISVTNHLFPLALSKGEHVLAVAVIGGSGGFLLAAGGPREIRAARTSQASGRPTQTPEDIRAAAERVLADGKASPRDRAHARLAIARAHAAAGDFARAREEFARVLEPPTHPFYIGEAQLGIGDTYWNERNWAAAEAAYRAVPADAQRDDAARAQARLDALAIRRRLRSDHPRLFFNADTWPAVRARLNENALRQQVVLPEQVSPRDYGDEDLLLKAALLFRLTGDRALLESMRRMLAASLEYYHEAHRQSKKWTETRDRFRLGSPYTRTAWLCALDWVWNDLTPAERLELASSMIRHIHEYLTRWPDVNFSQYEFYTTDSLYWYTALALLDAALDGADDVRAMDLLHRGYQDHLKMFRYRARGRGDDGGPFNNSWEYNFYHGPLAEWRFLHAWQAAVSAEIPDAFTSSVLTPNYVLWYLLPGNHEYGYGRSWHKTNRAEGGGQVPANLEQTVHFFGRSHPDYAALARALRERLGAPDHRIAVFPSLLELEAAPAAKIPAGLPRARHFSNQGQVFMNSGSGNADTYAMYVIGGSIMEEHHFGATHFTLYKQGFLTMSTGTRNAGAHSGCYYPNTVAHNALLVRAPEDVQLDQWHQPVPVNTGGQNVTPRAATALAFETGPDYTYAATDAAKTYNRHVEKCAWLTRQFLFLYPDYFVVFDRVTAAQADYPKTWLFHTANEPALAGREFRADQGQGRVFVRSHLPRDGRLESIGGPGREFWADSRNWPLPESWWPQHANELRMPGQIPEVMGRWRVEVKPGAARADDVFLHLVQASDQTVEAMVESRADERDDAVELTFEADGRAYAVTFRKTGAVGGHIRITDGGRTRVDRELTREIMPQSGLALAP